MADDEYNRKLESLQQYIPFLNNMILQLRDPRKKNREQQLTKMVSLHSMITDKKKKLKLETLIKCEDVILKLYDKVKSGSQTQPPLLRPPALASSSSSFSPITPSSPSPPRDIPKTKPVVIPTEKVADRDGTISQSNSGSSYKTKIDVYSSAADSLKSGPKNVFERLGKKVPDMSKPPISLEDLEALQDDSNSVDTERMSLNELTDLREKLQRQLSKDNKTDRSQAINTTVRNTTILTKKAVETKPKIPENKPKTPESVKPAVKTSPIVPVSKPVKVIKEASSIFGNALSSIDNKLLEGATTKLKEKERRNSTGQKKDLEPGEKKERRSSKDEKKSDTSSQKVSKDKTEVKKSSNEHGHKSKDKKDENEHSHKSKEKKDERKSKHEDPRKHDKTKTEKKHEEEESRPSEKPKEEKPKPETGQVYKRLADKYNPKPRKPAVEVEVPKSVSESIENSMKSSPAIPFLDTTAQSSPPKPLLPQPLMNVPLLSPTSSTNSIDNEILKPQLNALLPTPTQIPLPNQVSSILANPNATALINNVVNQFKARPPPPGLMHQTNFNTPNFASNYSNEAMQQGPSNYWGKQPPQNHPQNYPQRSFTPLPNQFDNQYYSQNATAANSYGHQAPPILSPQFDSYEARPPQRNHDDSLFGNKDRDMRYREEWRRPSNQWSPRGEQSSRDPRLHRDPRSYREASYRRDSREFEQRETRPKFRDPRLNRYQSNRFERPQTPNRSRSMSRESDETTNTFMSPLDSLYSNSDGSRRTGKGYGVQNFKIPKIKKEGDAEVEKEARPEAETEKPSSVQPKPEPPQKVVETKPEPIPTVTTTASTPPTTTPTESNAETPETDENVASTSVSSSTECDDKQPETETNTKGKEPAEVGEISSTNDIQESESRDDSKINETNQTEIINKFLKKLLENERTRAAASLFIDNVSNSLDDEKLKMVVQTVKSASTEEESQSKTRRLRKKGKVAVATKKKQVLKRNMKMKKRRRVVKPVIKDDDESEEEEEEEEAAEEEEEIVKEPVVVSVGERIKRRKRGLVNATQKKKKSRHKTELDLLHEDIQDMFIRDGVLTATGKRMCRLLKNDSDTKPPPPQIETRTRRSKVVSEKFDAKSTDNSDKLKVMSNVRVLIPKIPVERLIEVEDDGQRYSLRRSKGTKSYIEEDSDDDKPKEKKKKEESVEPEEKEEAKDEQEESVEEKEKVTSPRRVAHRKRSRAWASGIIPKKKRKEPAVEESEEEEEEAVAEKEPEKIEEPEKVEEIVEPEKGEEPVVSEKTEETSKTVELLEPDKNYYCSKPWNFKTRCKLCTFDGKNITKHYRVRHPESEVLSSRLSPTKAEQAIKESIEHKLDDFDDCKLASTRKYSFRCRFCDMDMNAKVSNFYDHISTHTGEYRHVCSLCTFGACNAKPVRAHYMAVHGKERDSKSSWIKTKVYGYICLECNYVQVNKNSVENHCDVYHKDEGKKIRKIYLSSLDHLIGVVKPPVTVPSVPENNVNDEQEKSEKESPPLEKKTVDKTPEAVKEKVIENEPEEPQPKKKKLDENPVHKPVTIKVEPEKTPPPVKKEKEIDMTVFTCNTDLHEENEKIEQERLKKMTELNDSVKTNRQSLSFVDQLRNRLLQEQKETPPVPEVVLVKSEPVDVEMEPETAEPVVVTPKKPMKVMEPRTSGGGSVGVVQKDNIKIQGMIQKLQGILKEEKTNMGEGPPPLTPLVDKQKDEGKTVLSAGFLNIVKDQDSMDYACRVPSCLFTSKDRERFITHWNEDHPRINQNYKMTKCRICQREISSSPENNLLINFFKHVEEEHLGIRRNILRTRRLSGDKLSTSKEETPPEKDDLDLKAEENPFPFKIAGVMSLAEETIPPLSPISPVVENKTPKIESVVLKESKLNATEKLAVWKCTEAMKKFLQCPRELYKCPQFFCKFATNLRHLFESHIKAHAALNDELVCCVYCDVKTPLSHSGLHIDLRHSNCLYSCSQCLYRALTREYVMVHIKNKHSESDSVISLPPKTAKTIMMSKQKRFSIKEACPPYRCGSKGCDQQFLFQDEYMVHLQTHEGVMVCGFKQKHLQCTYKCVIIDNMIDHWKSHNCFNYHCLICKLGCKELYGMLEHYAATHPNLEPIVIDRRSAPGGGLNGYGDEAFNKVKYVKEELLESSAPQTIVDKKSEPEGEGKGVTIVPLTLSEKKIIIIPKTIDVSNKLFSALTATENPQPVPAQPSFVFASVSPSDDNKEKEDESPKDDQNRIDEDVRSDDPLSLDGESGSVVMASGDESDSQDLNESNDMKSYGLIGYQLYRCAFCDISFSNARDFKTHTVHSKQCRDPNNTMKPLKCVHCERLFKNSHGLLEHIQYHGQLRFSCSLCVKKFPLASSLRLHMRAKHNVTSTVTTPLVPNKTNMECDEFVLRPVPQEPETSKEGPSLQNSPIQKRTYGPDEIEQLPTRYIFNSDVKCALCSYSTKVRTNLVRHLQFHSSEKSVPDIAPVNPVPCLDKNEKMFDKMTNLALSSFTAGRMGPKQEPKVEREQVQVPAYVPSHRRYVCCANGCNYLCLEEQNLRHHLFALHVQEPSFTCAHCKANLKTGIEGFLKHLKLHDLHLYKCSHCTFVHNLRHKVDKHGNDKHPDKVQKTITIRALEAEPGEADQSQGVVAIETPPPSNIKWTKPWHCGMCKYRCAAKNDIVTHIFNKHDINTQFKCTLCTYKTNEKCTFDEHFKESHPSNDIDVIHVYYKSEGAGQGVATNQKQFDTTPLWQRDRPRIRHIRGILFEDSSPQKEIKKRTMVRTPSAASSVSNLDLAIEAVAKGTDDTSKPEEESKVEEVATEETIIIIDDDDEDEDVEIETVDNEDMEQAELLIDLGIRESVVEDSIKAESQPQFLSEEMLWDKYGKMCSPGGKSFKCPICFKFRTKKISYFVYHLLVELKCHRFKCNSCEYSCISFDTMAVHCQDEHNCVITTNVTDMPVDRSVEYWIQLLIRYQAKIIVQGNPIQNGDEVQSSVCKSQCDFCQRWFKNIHMVKEHELSHWADHVYTCGHCCSEHVTLDELFQHTFIAHPSYEVSVNTKGPYVDKIIATLKSPPSNVLTPHQVEEVLYACSLCSETEKSVELLQKHFSERHGSDVEDCQFTLMKSKVDVMYCCTYCHERGSEELLRKHHQERHVGLKYSIYQYICLECSATFLNIKDLRGHFTKTHPTKKLTYSCVENKSSSTEQYSCTKCPFRSCSVGGIRSHLRKHLRPIDCLLCGATFIYPTEARNHHTKEHWHSVESTEENKDRLREYEDLVQQIVAARNLERAERPPPPRKMLARKSTGAPFVREYSYYGARKEEVDLKSVSTSIEVNNVTTKITVEQFSNIFNIFPVVELDDCGKGS